MVVWAAVLLYVGRDTDFFFDEWAFIQDRRGWNASAFLDAHNEHLSLVPVALYKAMFMLVGIDSYFPYRMLVVALHLVCVALVFTYARRCVGDVLGIVAACLLLFLGAAWQDLLWPFQVGYLGSVAAGIGALLALDRSTRGGDAAACLLISISIACSGLGLPIALGVAVEILARPDRWRRIWLVAVPVVLYAIWYAGYGVDALQQPDRAAAPRWAADAAASALGALVGPGTAWGPALLVVAVAGLVLVLGRRRVLLPRMAGVLVIALGFWALTAWGRAGVVPADASRYLYPSAAFIILVAAEALRGAPRPNWLLVFAALLAIYSMAANLQPLRDGARGLRANSLTLDAELAALELARDQAAPEAQPDTKLAPQIVAGKYLAAVDDLGSPADTARELAASPEGRRAAADRVSLLVLPASLRPSARPARGTGRPPVVIAATGTRPTLGAGCAVVQGRGAPSIQLRLPRRGLAVEATGDAPVEVRARRFASAFPADPIGTVAPRASATLAVPRDRGALPWIVQLSASGPFRACVASGR